MVSKQGSGGGLGVGRSRSKGEGAIIVGFGVHIYDFNDLQGGTATIRGVDPSAARVLLTQTPPEICSPTCRVRVKFMCGKE